MVTNSPLKAVSTITVPKGPDPFVASEKFVVDTTNKTKVRIERIGSHFNEWYLPRHKNILSFLLFSPGGKVEAPIKETNLVRYKLTRPTWTFKSWILQELSDSHIIETKLRHIYFLMSLQGHGQFGQLDTNGCANFFFVRDTNFILRTVVIYWRSGVSRGWNIIADPIGNNYIMTPTQRIFILE